jgi:hypothetical protein
MRVFFFLFYILLYFFPVYGLIFLMYYKQLFCRLFRKRMCVFFSKHIIDLYDAFSILTVLHTLILIHTRTQSYPVFFCYVSVINK